MKDYQEPSVPEKLMKGKGSAQPSVAGIIGKTHNPDSYTKSLGGVISNTKLNTYKDPLFKPSGYNTENGILGKNATHIAKEHYGQVPYQGKYMGRLGSKA
tara:strand:+ start:708 stop:1007 length:300 start_codon:yes stop_codon:yes gene_type:complete